VLEKNAYLLELSRYIHLNPVRAGMVQHPEDYKWSSYRGYIRKNKRVEWIEYAWILSQFGAKGKNACKSYKEFVKQGITANKESPFRKLYGQLVLGGEEFVEKIRLLVQAEELDQEIVERQRLRSYPSPQKILRLVAKVFEVRESVLVEKGSRNNPAKKVAIFLIKKYSGLGNKEIGHLFGGLHYSSITKAVTRLEAELAKDKKMSALVTGLMSNVKT